jgi:capsular exopolysaccharide synthesis family protein
MSRFYQALREASRSGTLGQSEIPVAEDLAPGKQVPPAANGRQDPLEGNAVGAGFVDDRVDGGMEQPAPKPQPLSREVAAETAAFTQRSLFRIIPKAKLDHHARVLPNAVDQAVVERYRRLRTKLMQEQATKPFRSLMVTSASPQEGKTVTVLNLGLSFAMLPDFKVLVVDGDIRRGSLGKWLGADEHRGLSNLIDGSANLEEVVLKADDLPVHFMARGNSPVSAAELLHSPELTNCFLRMTEYFSLVLIDSPPVNLVTDAQLLAKGCDAVLLVVRAFVTTRKSLERTVQDLQSFRVLGTVLNCGTRAQLDGRYRGYY